MTQVLGGQSAIEGMFAGNLNVGGVATNIFSQKHSARIFRSGAELPGALGLQDFAVEYNPEDRFSFRVSRQLAGPLYLEYWRSLSTVNRVSFGGLGAWEFKFSYHLRSNLQLCLHIQRTEDERIPAGGSLQVLETPIFGRTKRSGRGVTWRLPEQNLESFGGYQV